MNNEPEQTEPLLQVDPEPFDLPFPFSRHTYCLYEPIDQRIEEMRVLIVDNLLRDEHDLSDLARVEWGKTARTELKRERQIAELALQNIGANVQRLVRKPEAQIVHVSALAAVAEEFNPDAIILSGTLRDFDYYDPEILESFARFVRTTTIPLLGIGGAHELIGLSFGARVITLDGQEQSARRVNRVTEYQYRMVRIVKPEDPIFQEIDNPQSGLWQDYSKHGHILRVWQNHGLQLDRVPEGFVLLATSYLCRNQMMVRRNDEQLIYTVQFHLEKSFEDWSKNRTRWEHQNESRDGRILLVNFLLEAEKHARRTRAAQQRGIWLTLQESSEARTQAEPLYSAQVAEAYALARIKDNETGPFFVNSAFVLQVAIQDSLSEDIPDERDSHRLKQELLEFDVVIHGQDIKNEADWVKPYAFRRSEKVHFIEFELIPTKRGRKVISIEFLYQLHWMANINLEVEVIESQDLNLVM